MHGKIFQLEEKPLRFEEDFACEEDFYDDFVGRIADYVSDDIDKNTEIFYFIDELKKYGIDYNYEEQSIVFLEGFKEKYFEKRFEGLKEMVRNISLKEFIEDTVKVWKIENLINKKYDIYIYHGEIWMTMDDFIREYMEENKKYYIGTVLDYHF